MEMFRYLTGALDKEEKKIWKILVFFCLLNPIINIFSFSAILYIIDIITREGRVSAEMTLFAFLMGGVSVLAGLFELYRCKLCNRLEYQGAHRLSVKICELIIKEDLSRHSQKSAMQALAMIRSDTQNCIEIVITGIQLITELLTITGCSVVLIYAAGWMGIISCFLLLLFMAGMYRMVRKPIRDYGEQCRKNAIKTNAQVTIAYGAYKEMKLSDSAGVVLKRYQDASGEYAGIQKKFMFQKSIIRMIMQNSVMSILFLLLAFLMWKQGEQLLHVLTSMIFYITVLIRMIPLAYSIVNEMNDIEFHKKSYEVLRENLEQYNVMKKAEEMSGQIRQKQLTFQKGIQVRKLSFRYNDSVEIFKDAEIAIPTGSSVAIIGPSGAGKTTFLDLVLGLLKPQTGSILYDDYDIVSQTDSMGSCQAKLGTIVSYIPQIVYLNNETICNNVAFFDNEDNIDNERVIECLKFAQIWEEVERMPEGINTIIGENGTVISGGQRQRIALARALYKEFELLVMDEATAALDMETEKAVIDSIRKIKGTKTLLMATHHMSLAGECDLIYKIENQKITRVK